MSSSRHTISVSEPEKVVASGMFFYTLGEWQKIREALQKGAGVYHGPTWDMVQAIDKLVEDLNKTIKYFPPISDASS